MRVKLEAFYCTGFASPANLPLNRTTHSAFVARFAHQPKPGAPGEGVLYRFTYMLQTVQSQSRVELLLRLTILQLVHNTYMPQICFPFALFAPMMSPLTYCHTACRHAAYRHARPCTRSHVLYIVVAMLQFVAAEIRRLHAQRHRHFGGQAGLAHNRARDVDQAVHESVQLPWPFPPSR